LKKEVFQKKLARLEKLVCSEFSGLKNLIFRCLRLEKLKPKVARLGSAQLRLDICWLVYVQTG
jgi:hypothetical protein